MSEQDKQLIEAAYKYFNARDIDQVCVLLHPDVHWPNGWEGGYVEGHAGVSDYWTRQWKELDPTVQPIVFTEMENGQIEVEVHQVVNDLTGHLLADIIVKHIYTLENGLIKSMEIVHP